MINAEVTKSKIISILERRGPSLPIQIAKDLNMNSIFTSAFLSELLDDKKIRVSYLKVGGSPLYFLYGQEQKLENFYNYLHPKEAEAYLMLKDKKVLKDSIQDPAIRVALRAIKDFAFSFKNDEDLYWRYLTTSEQDVVGLFLKEEKNEIKDEKKNKVNEEAKEEKREEIIVREIEIKEEKVEEKEEPERKDKIESDNKLIEEILKKDREKSEDGKEKAEKKEFDRKLFDNPLAIKIKEKPKKEKPRSEFVIKVIAFIDKCGWRLIEEKEYKNKEFFGIVEVPTELGSIAFLTIAKDKKLVSESDLDGILRQAQTIPVPALFLHCGSLNKKALEYQRQYYSVIKVKKIE